jgi:hypothetical protein
MAFQTDERMDTDLTRVEVGEYLITFISDHGQVRADFFRRGTGVTAHVWFPTGLDATKVTDGYYSELWDYAREHEFQDRFRVVLSE